MARTAARRSFRIIPGKGTQKWTEQQAAAAPAVTGSQSETVAVPPAKRKDAPPTNGEIPVNHGKVVREFGDGVHAFMEDGTIRTSGFAGYTYSTPENMSNIDLFKVLNPYTPPTAEELERKRRNRSETRYLRLSVTAYRHSRTCSSPRSTLQICTPVRIPCQNVPK